MRIAQKLSIGAALLGSVILSFAGTAQAYDHWDHRDRWEREHDRGWRDHGWHSGRDRVIERRVVEERPVYMRERPVFVAPQPVYQPPVYQQPAPSGLNLNFNIPLN